MDKKPPKKNRHKNRQVAVLQFPRDATTIDPTPLEAYPEHAKLIAFIISEYTVLEYKLAVLLALEMSADEKVILPMIAAVDSGRNRLAAISAGLSALAGDNFKRYGDFKKLTDRAARILDLRNKYGHAHFGHDADSGELAIASVGGKRAPTNVPLHDLNHVFGEVRAFSHLLGVKIAGHFPGLLEAPPAPATPQTNPQSTDAGQTDPQPPAPVEPSPE